MDILDSDNCLLRNSNGQAAERDIVQVCVCVCVCVCMCVCVCVYVCVCVCVCVYE